MNKIATLEDHDLGAVTMFREDYRTALAEGHIDLGMEEICNAFNTIPGIATVYCCSGHGGKASVHLYVLPEARPVLQEIYDTFVALFNDYPHRAIFNALRETTLIHSKIAGFTAHHRLILEFAATAFYQKAGYNNARECFLEHKTLLLYAITTVTSHNPPTPLVLKTPLELKPHPVSVKANQLLLTAFKVAADNHPKAMFLRRDRKTDEVKGIRVIHVLTKSRPLLELIESAHDILVTVNPMLKSFRQIIEPYRDAGNPIIYLDAADVPSPLSQEEATIYQDQLIPLLNEWLDTHTVTEE